MNENKRTVKNIFYPLFVLVFLFVLTALLSSCSLVFQRVDVSYESLDHLVFANRDSNHLITFIGDEAVEQKETVYSQWDYTISGKQLRLTNAAEESKIIYVFSKSKLFDESERVYLYQVQL